MLVPCCISLKVQTNPELHDRLVALHKASKLLVNWQHVSEVVE